MHGCLWHPHTQIDMGPMCGATAPLKLYLTRSCSSNKTCLTDFGFYFSFQFQNSLNRVLWKYVVLKHGTVVYPNNPDFSNKACLCTVQLNSLSAPLKSWWIFFCLNRLLIWFSYDKFIFMFLKGKPQLFKIFQIVFAGHKCLLKQCNCVIRSLTAVPYFGCI